MDVVDGMRDVAFQAVTFVTACVPFTMMELLVVAAEVVAPSFVAGQTSE